MLPNKPKMSEGKGPTAPVGAPQQEDVNPAEIHQMMLDALRKLDQIGGQYNISLTDVWSEYRNSQETRPAVPKPPMPSSGMPMGGMSGGVTP